jgi:hypothetical protein
MKKIFGWTGLKQIPFLLLYGILSLLFLTLVFEIAFRFQIVDTYSPELRSYNRPQDLTGSDGRPTMLVMGDSFTAGTATYVNILRGQLPDYRVINAGIPGTGIIEAAIIAPRRFQQFSPAVFIYQVYVGNDLFDITHPVNWATISPARNLYWGLSNYFRSLGFLNYRLGQRFASAHEIISGRKPGLPQPKELPLTGEKERAGASLLSERKPDLPQAADLPARYEAEPFSAAAYTERSKIQLQADPWLLDKQVGATGEKEGDFETFLRKLKDLTSHCPSDQCQTYLLVIPHCSQLNAKYLDNFKRLGGRVRNEGAIQENEYPFIRKLRLAVAPRPGLTVLNPLEYLRRREALGEPVYFQHDEHLTPAGQKAIADFLVSESGIRLAPKRTGSQP